MDLTQRQQVILKAVVEEFTRTAQPIGSKSLIPVLGISISSATIRNELALLEKEGLLEKTHTSSGRIPSQKGYRYYVENLMELSLDENMEEALRQVFSKRHLSLEDVISISCSILSEMTHLTSIALEPEQSRQTLIKLSLIPVSKTQAVAVVVTDTGQTEHRIFTFSSEVSIDDLKACTDLLNDNLRGTPMNELLEKMEEIKPLLAAHVSRHEVLFEAFVSAFMGFASHEAKVYGRANMLAQPDFTDVGQLEQLMRILENESLLHAWTEKPGNISTPIGERNELIQIGDCSVVCARFAAGQKEPGQLMVIGPSRMPYAKVIALMDYMSEQIERLFGTRLEGVQDEQKPIEETGGSQKAGSE